MCIYVHNEILYRQFYSQLQLQRYCQLLRYRYILYTVRHTHIPIHHIYTRVYMPSTSHSHTHPLQRICLCQVRALAPHHSLKRRGKLHTCQLLQVMAMAPTSRSTNRLNRTQTSWQVAHSPAAAMMTVTPLLVHRFSSTLATNRHRPTYTYICTQAYLHTGICIPLLTGRR